MKIERVEVRVVGPETRRYSWSHDLPEQYQTLTLLRIFTDQGIEGVAGVWNATSYGYERYTAEALRHLIPVLVGRDPMAREQLAFDLRPRVWPQPPGALAAIDIALWDIAGKVAEVPIHRLLGGARRRIPAYASTPMLDDVDAYLAIVDQLIEQGFRAVKFHTWCVPDRDLALARAVRRRHPEIDFMLDAENNYDLAGALRVAEELADLGFRWLEAPLPDHDYDGYRALTRQAAIPVIPSGNWIQDLATFEQALRSRCWGAARTDVVMMGGLAPARQAMALAEAADTTCELMSWGYTLASAANLHLMLGAANCTYYELPLPLDVYEYGMLDVIRIGPDGFVDGPEAPGLGYAVDWQAMAAATIHSLSYDRRGEGEVRSG